MMLLRIIINNNHILNTKCYQRKYLLKITTTTTLRTEKQLHDQNCTYVNYEHNKC